MSEAALEDVRSWPGYTPTPLHSLDTMRADNKTITPSTFCDGGGSLERESGVGCRVSGVEGGEKGEERGSDA